MCWNHRKAWEIIENHEILENLRKSYQIFGSYVEIIKSLRHYRKLYEIENHIKTYEIMGSCVEILEKHRKSWKIFGNHIKY